MKPCCANNQSSRWSAGPGSCFIMEVAHGGGGAATEYSQPRSSFLSQQTLHLLLLLLLLSQIDSQANCGKQGNQSSL